MSNDAEILLEMANANAALGRAIVELMLERDELRKRNRELQRQLEPWEPQGPKYTRKEASAWAARFGGKPVARVAHFATEVDLRALNHKVFESLIKSGSFDGFGFERSLALIPERPRHKGWNQGDLHAGWLDVDGDGLIDLLVVDLRYGAMYRNLGDGSARGLLEDSDDRCQPIAAAGGSGTSGR